MTTTDLYAVFPPDLAQLAREGEERVITELSKDALAALYLPETLQNYRLVAVALLEATDTLAASLADAQPALRMQRDKEISVLVENVKGRVEQSRATMLSTMRMALASARRSAAFGGAR
jgi:hypothetical protein